MIELDEFYNQGFGWICKRCEQESRTAATTADEENLTRIWHEGEAESKEPKLSASLVKWVDAARTQLICPRCGIFEVVNKA